MPECRIEFYASLLGQEFSADTLTKSWARKTNLLKAHENSRTLAEPKINPHIRTNLQSPTERTITA